MSKLLRVNMGTLEAKFEDLGDYENLGGRALTSMVVSKEVPPMCHPCHPLGEHNKLVIATGLLTGTSAANAGRLSFGGKSPLTGGIKESNVGGTASSKLAKLDIRAVVVEGKSAPGTFSVLVINKDGATLQPAGDCGGLKNYDLAEKLQEAHGSKVGIISIGPAGEMKLSAASIAVTDTHGRPTRHAGRGGLGAVMGSKGLKAIVIDSTDGPGVTYHDRDAFKEAARVFREAIQTHDLTKADGALAVYGTNVLAGVINGAGAYPTRNFSEGTFEGIDKVSGETMHDVIEERGGEVSHSACTGCIIKCSNVYLDKNKQYLTSAFEYETIWANGANCGIDDLDVIAQIDRLCDEFGLDTIEMGCAVGVAMAGGLKAFGDGEGAIELISEIGKGTPLGRIIGSGAAVVGQVFGVEDVPVVKRQGLPAYDPRAVKGIGVTYATSPMGADHTAGYSIAMNILKVGGYVDPLKPEGQADISRALQVATTSLDSAGLCLFVAFAVLDIPEGFAAIPKMLNARFGWNLTADDLASQAQKILETECSFNRAAGFDKSDDRLPEFFLEKKLATHDVVFDVPDEELDRVLQF